MTEAQPESSRPGGYPYMSTAQFGLIRARLKSSLPRAITPDWLQSVLSISDKGARNLSPQLRRLGLIDREGNLQQPLVNNFREDDTFADACRTMIEAVYPQALLDAFPQPHEDVAGVASWFRRNANTGERMADFQARFLAQLSSGVPPVPGERLPSRSADGNGVRTVAAKKTAAKKATSGKPDAGSTQPSGTGSRHEVSSPSIHLDVQIHLDPATDPAQIDAVFASLARHIYGK